MNYIAWPEFLKTLMPAGNSEDYWEKKLSGPALHFCKPSDCLLCSTSFRGEGCADTSAFECKRFKNKQKTQPPLQFGSDWQ